MQLFPEDFSHEPEVDFESFLLLDCQLYLLCSDDRQTCFQNILSDFTYCFSLVFVELPSCKSSFPLLWLPDSFPAELADKLRFDPELLSNVFHQPSRLFGGGYDLVDFRLAQVLEMSLLADAAGGILDHTHLSEFGFFQLIRIVGGFGTLVSFSGTRNFVLDFLSWFDIKELFSFCFDLCSHPCDSLCPSLQFFLRESEPVERVRLVLLCERLGVEDSLPCFEIFVIVANHLF